MNQKGDELNLDLREAERFNAMAARWWDPEGDSRPLHDMNGPRTSWILERAEVRDKAVLDIGCGGGLLCESLSVAGARVTGIDAAEKPLAVARMHASGSGLEIDYRNSTAEQFAEDNVGAFDVVCCMELIEHVPDPASLVDACARLARPDGDLFFSTINRNPLAWAMAILGAEYVLGLLPRGTHRYDRLITPGELAAACRAAGVEVIEIAGMRYNPFSRTVAVGGQPMVNYLLHARKPA